MAKKKTTNKNVNKNVNKNNINITINNPKKRTYKKRSTGNPSQPRGYTVFNPTIINQIPSQNTKPADDFKKMAYEYNIPRNPPKDDPSVYSSKSAIKAFPYIPRPVVSRNISTIDDYDNSSIASSSIFSDQTAHSGPYFDEHIPPNRVDNKMSKMKKSEKMKISPTIQPLLDSLHTYKPEYFEPYFNDQVPTTQDDDSIPDLIPFVDTQQPFNALKKNRIESKINRINEKYIQQQEKIRKAYEQAKQYEPLEVAEKQLENKNVTILRPEKQQSFQTFQTQIPFSEGFTTPEKRRETLLPRYEAPADDVRDISLSTPDLMARMLKPVMRRRNKNQMIEARTMENEDKNAKTPMEIRRINSFINSKTLYEKRQQGITAMKKRQNDLADSLSKTKAYADSILASTQKPKNKKE